MNPPDLALYVTSNNVDHGPLSLKETTERVQSGDFKGDDLAWHQGVSGWMPLKELPEWDAMQAPPPLEKKEEPPKLIPEESAPKMNLSEKKDKSLQANPASRSPLKQTVKNEREFQDDAAPAPQGMGTGGKVLIAFALLIFLGTLGVVGFFVYKNMDKFVQ
jgi:hypothetical protein